MWSIIIKNKKCIFFSRLYRYWTFSSSYLRAINILLKIERKTRRGQNRVYCVWVGALVDLLHNEKILIEAKVIAQTWPWNAQSILSGRIVNVSANSGCIYVRSLTPSHVLWSEHFVFCSFQSWTSQIFIHYNRFQQELSALSLSEKRVLQIFGKKYRSNWITLWKFNTMIVISSWYVVMTIYLNNKTNVIFGGMICKS